MQILLYLFYSLLGYGWWWIAFVGLAYCAARYTPWPCIPAAFLIVAALMGYLSVKWVQAEMDKPGWDGSPLSKLTPPNQFYGLGSRILLGHTGFKPQHWRAAIQCRG
jgi:hypothetical protein